MSTAPAPPIADRLTKALDDARNYADAKGDKIVLPLAVYQLLYYTALNARNELRGDNKDLGA